jgi:hypothetical protein
MATQVPGPVTPGALFDLARANELAPGQETDKTWYREPTIAGAKWNQLFPYQLIVVDRQADGTYVRRREKGWTYTLPMSPESLSIEMPFAITTSVTMGGYVEHHNGTPIRMLQLSGTFGVFFGRGEAKVPPQLTFAESILGGTISAFQSTLQAARDIPSAYTGKEYNTNSADANSFDSGQANEKATGYFQARLLQAFFDSYAEFKKTKAGRNSRLAFAIWKQEAVYLVQPIDYRATQSADSPLEYRYSLTLKATKRVKLTQGAMDIAVPYVPVQRDPGKLAKLLATVTQARQVLQNARKTIIAIGGDVEHSLFEPMRELSMFAKDALAVPLSIADLGDSLVQSTRTAVMDLAQTRNDITHFPQNIRGAYGSYTKDLKDSYESIRQFNAERSDDDGRDDPTRSADAATSSRNAHPANNPFLNPSDNFSFFSTISVGDLHLPPATMTKIAAERERVRNLTRADFEARRNAISAVTANFANAIGLGSSTYNATYNITAPTNQAVTRATDEDFEALFALNALIMEMNRLVVTTDREPRALIDAIASVAGMASRSGIAFQMPRSKYAVPFPYGSTLEMLSTLYLGTPDRWHEIAALNGLQAPYVDEQGFELPLLTTGAGNTLLVEDASQLFVGQPVWVESIGKLRSKRRVTKIDHLSADQHLITVDGPADLDGYSPQSLAKLIAFLPNTVNSQMLIYIPSSIEPKDGDFQTKSIPGVDEFDRLIAVGGVDLLLDQKNDLIITPDGDARWAVGLTNIIQKVRLALSVRQGTLNRHPEYGLPLVVGQSIADTDAVDIAKAVQSMVAGDPTFTGVRGATVNITGPVARLAFGVEVSGVSQVIPVSIDVKQ